MRSLGHNELTHQGWMTHIQYASVNKAGFSSDSGSLWIETQETNFSEISKCYNFHSRKSLTHSLKKMHLKMSFAKWQPFCLCLNVLTSNIAGKLCQYNVCRCPGSLQPQVIRRQDTDYMYIDGLVQDCSISIANTLEILQSYSKPLICNVTLCQWG